MKILRRNTISYLYNSFFYHLRARGVKLKSQFLQLPDILLDFFKYIQMAEILSCGIIILQPQLNGD